MPQPNWTPENKALFVKMWNEGAALKTIGRQFDIGVSSVTYNARKEKLPRRIKPQVVKGHTIAMTSWIDSDIARRIEAAVRQAKRLDESFSRAKWFRLAINAQLRIDER
jgi:transposase-like protein